MGMSAGGARGGMKSDINVTPLVDVVLVLLIIFMVLTPMMKQRGKDVELPKAAQSEKEEQEEPVVLSMTPDRQLFVESDAYPDEAAFKSRLQEELRRKPGRRFVLKADQSLAYGDVQKVIRLARSVGVDRVSFGVEVPQAR